MNPLYGGIEAGGTKFVCMVGGGPDRIAAEAIIPTTQPDETLQRTIDFFKPYVDRRQLGAIGIGSFGPVDLNPDSPTYGFITTTPKPGWGQVDLRGRIASALKLPTAFDTDVYSAAFGEHRWAAENRALDPFVYMTVGTGIGMGVIANGRAIHGLVHPEGGHLLLPHDLQKDPFPGSCPFHGDCLEGLASGPSMQKRWGQRAETLPEDHPGWDLESDYLALALADLIYLYSPQRIVLGGGVPQHPGLHADVRRKVKQFLSGYVRSRAIEDDIQSYIVPPVLGNRSGVLGAIAMAMEITGK